ncbi:MAG: erythromycin biosynthesis sensory transduction protein eryC1 [Victivallales bacterium]|nr:erythromycin biosynthesis sensory transduction protein eryC1 [Victivallales bacterium]
MPDTSFILPSDLKANYAAYRDELREAALRVLDSGWYIGGSEVEAFETAFAAFAETDHAVGVATGTDAIILAIRACGIGPGDVVITVSHTAVATVAAVELAGATAALVDVDPDTFGMDPDALAAACESLADGHAGQLKAVLPVHIYGHPVDLSAIQGIVEEHNLILIEDCAQAHGARLKGQRVGSFGALGTFSFYPTKNLGALGDGGAIATNAPGLAAQVRLLKEYGWQERYVSHVAGMNSRLDPIQAAMLAVKLQHLDDENAKRREIAARYTAALADTPLILPACADNVEPVYHQYVVQHEQRDELQQFLRARNIGSLIHSPVPVHKQPAYEGRVELPAGPLTVTEGLAKRILSLPIHAQLTDEQFDRTVAAVRDWVATL